MKTNYAFDVAAEIVSDKPFGEIPVSDLCAAMRKRLDEIEKTGTRDPFSSFDEMEAESDD
jgi:hypothetical protein